MIELLKAFLEAKKSPHWKEPAKSKKSQYPGVYYSTIEDINNATTKALSDNNLIIIPAVKDNILSVKLYHTLTNQWIEDNRMLVSEKPGNQAIGAAQSYQLRYALKALLNICGNDDEDDGQAEQAYIDKQVIKKKEAELAGLLINVKEHVLQNKYVADMIKEKFNIDFTSDSLHHVEKSKLDEVVKFIKSR